MPNKIDMVGKKCGRLGVIMRSKSRNKVEPIRWFCICECGNYGDFGGVELRNGHTKSCGCLKKESDRESHTKHGMTYSPEAQAWSRMKGRCYDKNNKNYHYYGGRGISVCKRWKNSFENFFEDMQRRPSNKHSLDRINVNKGYKPSNCRWATPEQQSRNMRSNKSIKFRCYKMLKTDWADYLGISQNNLGKYLKRGNNMNQLYRFYLNKNKKLPWRKTQYNKHVIIVPTKNDLSKIRKPTKWCRKFLTKDIYPQPNPLTPKDEIVYSYFLNHPGEYLTPTKIAIALNNPERKHSNWACPALKKLLSEGKITAQYRGQYKVIQSNNKNY